MRFQCLALALALADHVYPHGRDAKDGADLGEREAVAMQREHLLVAVGELAAVAGGSHGAVLADIAKGGGYRSKGWGAIAGLTRAPVRRARVL